MLGSDAVYRVVGQNERGVEVEVIEAPGLQAGSRFTFTLDDVRAMQRLSAADHPTSSVRTPSPRRRTTE